LYYIKNIFEINSEESLYYGDKAVNISKLKIKKFLVPNGYALSYMALNDFLSFNNISTIDKNIQELIETGTFPDKIIKSISYIWDTLCINCNKESIIIRSSAIGEDSLEHSFAGIYESFLNILSLDDMKTAIKKCWASYYSEQAKQYRDYNKIKSKGMGVIIQRLIVGVKSGVLFTINPINKNDEQMIIESSYGLNIGVVDGTTPADSLCIGKNGEIISKTTAKKKLKYSLGKKSFELKIDNVENSIQQQFSLSKDEIGILVDIGKRIENTFGVPCDIEWTISDNEIFVLQCRPIVLQKASSIIRDVPFDSNISEEIECSLLDRYAEPACICYLSLLKSWQEVVYLSFYNKKEGKLFNEKPLLFYFNRVYWNQSYQRNFFDDVPFLQSKEKNFTKKIKLLLLMLIGSKSWYLRINRYEKKLSDLKERFVSTTNLSDTWIILQSVINVFCKYIGKDHYRFLGIAQIAYNLLSVKLKEMYNYKEILAGLIESGSSKNMTIKSNHELFCLAQLAKSSPEINTIFLTCPVINIYNKISKSCSLDAEKFMHNFDSFINKHGHRGTSCDDLYSPHWIEKPEIVLEIIKQFLLNPSYNLEEFSICNEDIKKHYNDSKKKVFQYVEQSSNSILNRFWRKTEILFFTKMSSQYMALRENQRYYFDKSWLLIRKLLFSIGSILKEHNIINDTEDIFHMTIDEIALLVQDSEYRVQKDWRRIIEARIHTYNKNAKIEPPYLIKNDSLYRVQVNVDKMSFKAIGISSGTATGQVRIVSNVKDLSKVKDGDIVIVSTFHPSWTPILGIVSGLVMNYGNILSHGAVVAREYRIPVVIFNDAATSVFKNGQWININGDTGRIKIINEESSIY